MAATWQTEQMRGAGRSRAKNWRRWQLRQEACSGWRVTSGKAASPARASFQSGEGNWWHLSHACWCSRRPWENLRRAGVAAGLGAARRACVRRCASARVHATRENVNESNKQEQAMRTRVGGLCARSVIWMRVPDSVSQTLFN